MTTLASMTTPEFCSYLLQLEDDLRESGSDATADDYQEARLRLLMLTDPPEETFGSPQTATVYEAREAQRQLEVKIMVLIREFEERFDMNITKAEMMNYQDTPYFSTVAFLHRKRKEDS